MSVMCSAEEEDSDARFGFQVGVKVQVTSLHILRITHFKATILHDDEIVLL